MTWGDNAPWRKPSMRCACPNDTMICIAMASNAHHAPCRRFVRIQRIQPNIQAESFNSGPMVDTVAPRGRRCQWRTMALAPPSRYRKIRPWQSSAASSSGLVAYGASAAPERAFQGRRTYWWVSLAQPLRPQQATPDVTPGSASSRSGARTCRTGLLRRPGAAPASIAPASSPSRQSRRTTPRPSRNPAPD